jgi:N-acetyl-gamma-glutamyl-phosphate reductase
VNIYSPRATVRTMSEHTVGVVGATGYLGSELLRLLSTHPSLRLQQAISSSHAGSTLEEVCPWLPDGHAIVLEKEPSTLDVDLAFLALPAGEAPRFVPDLLARGIRVVDLGPDYRYPTTGQDGSPSHGLSGVQAEAAHQAVYGLTEANRDQIAPAKLVANPGCYPTATLLPLLPLAQKGLLPAHIVVDAKSGTSGAGASPTAFTHHSQAGASVTPYGGGNHRHVPEIRAALSSLGGAPPLEAPQITFVPHLVPVVRGLLCSIYAPGADGEIGAWDQALHASYDQAPFVRIGPVPRLPWAVGSNRCFLATERASPSAVVYSALDNLVKGGAGQAVQNANLMLGLPETDGLPLGGLGP